MILSQADEAIFAHRLLQADARLYHEIRGDGNRSPNHRDREKGRIHVSRAVSARLLHNLFPDPASSQLDLAPLSNRELQVFQVLGAGCRSSEIASALTISIKTADTYRENLKDKLRCENSEELVQCAKRWVETGAFETK